MEKFQLEQKIVEMIKTVYDPEIPVNIYDLGLIYRIEVKEDDSVEVDMTLTAPNCLTSSIIKSAAGQLGAVSVISTSTLSSSFTSIR